MKCHYCEKDATSEHVHVMDPTEYSCDDHRCPHCRDISPEPVYLHDGMCYCKCYWRGKHEGRTGGTAYGFNKGVKTVGKLLTALVDTYTCDEHRELYCYSCEKEENKE